MLLKRFQRILAAGRCVPAFWPQPRTDDQLIKTNEYNKWKRQHCFPPGIMFYRCITHRFFTTAFHTHYFGSMLVSLSACSSSSFLRSRFRQYRILSYSKSYVGICLSRYKKRLTLACSLMQQWPTAHAFVSGKLHAAIA